MLFEERKIYQSPIITIEKFEPEDIITSSSTGNDSNNDNSYDVDDTPGWLPGWY